MVALRCVIGAVLLFWGSSAHADGAPPFRENQNVHAMQDTIGCPEYADYLEVVSLAKDHPRAVIPFAKANQCRPVIAGMAGYLDWVRQDAACIHLSTGYGCVWVPSHEIGDGLSPKAANKGD